MVLFSSLAADCTCTLLLLTLFLVLFLWINGRKTKAAANFPAGPTPLPLIGNLHQLDLRRLDRSLMELSEKYGTVFSVEIGMQKAVVLTGYHTVKDALVNHADQFAGRPHIPIFEELSLRRGVVLSDGKPWLDARALVLATLRDFGMGKKSIEDKIIEETSFLVKVIESHKGQPFETRQIINSAISNIICSILFGDRFDYDDKTFISLTVMNTEIVALAGSASIQLFNSYPFLGFLIPNRQRLMKNQQKMHAIFNELLKPSQETLSENSIQNLSQALMMRQQQKSGGQDLELQKKDLLVTIMDLFGAGTETITTTICWGLLLMMKYPEIQKKVQQEIDGVIGAGRFPRTEDRKHMPYTDAVIHEIQRFANVVPLNLPHSTTVDMHLRGYFLPKGTYVIPMLTSVLFDKTQWEKPHEFNPSHFLDAEGKFVKRDAFLAFSAGRRACAGEALARVELFLFFTTLLQKFHFHCPPGVTDVDLTPRKGIILVPVPQGVCARPR
uniref:cytochrome P450 2K1-like n=1 Tax=Pristiophorus japonicus TaxID=55135 RepID=UPI00398F8B84